MNFESLMLTSPIFVVQRHRPFQVCNSHILSTLYTSLYNSSSWCLCRFRCQTLL